MITCYCSVLKIKLKGEAFQLFYMLKHENFKGAAHSLCLRCVTAQSKQLQITQASVEILHEPAEHQEANTR